MWSRARLLRGLTVLCLTLGVATFCLGCDDDFEDEFDVFFEVVDEWWYDDYHYDDHCCGGESWGFDFWYW